jgi:amino acid transporter
MAVYLVATLAFFVLGAAVLHEIYQGEGLPNKVAGMLDVLSTMYRPVLGPRVANAFIVVGAFAVLYSTLFAATAGNSRLLADFARCQGWVDPQSEPSFRKVVRGMCVALPIIGFILYLTIANPVHMVTIGGMMQALSLPPIACAAVYLRYRATDPRLRPKPLWDIFLWASLVGFSYAGWIEISKLWQK